MSYNTNGKYQTWGDYLVGYKIITPKARSLHENSFKYKEGHWAVARDLNEGGGIFHAAELHEVQGYFTGLGRVARLLMRADDLIAVGRAERAFVQAISPVLFKWPTEQVEYPVVLEPAAHWWQKPVALETQVKEALPALPASKESDYITSKLLMLRSLSDYYYNSSNTAPAIYGGGK